jgi:hypothetical protein
MNADGPRTMDELREFIAASPETEKFLNSIFKPSPDDVIRSIAEAARSTSATSSPGCVLAEIRRLAENYLDPNPAAKAIRSFSEGADQWDVAGLIESAADAHHEVDSIDAMGSSAGVFRIAICKAGPLYFTHAPEFDSIKWFTSAEAASNHAWDEYSGYIEALGDQDEEEEDEEEEDSAGKR